MRFLIVNTDDKTVVEEHNEKHNADRACAALNDHEQLNGRVPCYIVQPTCPQCHSDEMELVDIDDENYEWLCMSCHYVLSLKGKHK